MNDDSRTPNSEDWVELTTYSSGFEADYAVETLAARGIPARSQGNDIVGVFGPGFQAPNARGVRLFVQSKHVAAANEALEDVGPE